MSRIALALFLLLALAPVAPAGAVDGVIEINQARATAGGVTPGDLGGVARDAQPVRLVSAHPRGCPLTR
jgi:hypothetical protein